MPAILSVLECFVLNALLVFLVMVLVNWVVQLLTDELSNN